MRVPVAVAILVLVIWASVSHAGYDCIHDRIVDIQRRTRATAAVENQQYSTTALPQQGNTQPLRIKIDTRFLDGDTTYSCYTVGQVVSDATGSNLPAYTCKQTDILTATERNYLLNTLVPRALTLLQNTLHVVPVQGDLALPSSGSICTYGVNYPSQPVAETDLYIFLVARPTNNNALAYAASCVDDQYSRAVAGYINVNPSSISTDLREAFSQRGTIVHEISHILGFTPNKFGIVLRGINRALGADGAITSPAVVSFARNHFNCPSLTGAKLENDGQQGTLGSHWEKEQWMNEYMTGTSTQNPVFSALTLSLFQDSGWYYVNYDYAETLYFGYQAGCTFAASCNGWPVGNGYGCTEGSPYQCTFDLQAKGGCATGSSLTTCPYVSADSIIDGWCTVIIFPYHCLYFGE